MATLNIFVSFQFDKDDELKNQFYKQAKTVHQSSHQELFVK